MKLLKIQYVIFSDSIQNFKYGARKIPSWEKHSEKTRSVENCQSLIKKLYYKATNA